MPRHEMAQHGTACHGMAWYGTARNGTAWHGTKWHDTPWHGTARHGMAWKMKVLIPKVMQGVIAECWFHIMVIARVTEWIEFLFSLSHCFILRVKITILRNSKYDSKVGFR